MSSPFTLENPVFSKFAFYSGVVLSKTLLMSELVAWTRTAKQTFTNEEDVKMFANHGTVAKSDPFIERMRRCHLNDLENVFPFVLVGLFYVSTKPGETEATRVFQIFAASRLIHSAVYLSSARQPSRAACFLVGYGATVFMAYKLFRAVC